VAANGTDSVTTIPPGETPPGETPPTETPPTETPPTETPATGPNFLLAGDCPPDCSTDNPQLQIPETPEDPEALVALYDEREGDRTDEYNTFFGEQRPPISLDQAREILRDIERDTGKIPVLLYPGFVPLTALGPQLQARTKALQPIPQPTPEILWEFTEGGMAIDRTLQPTLRSQGLDNQGDAVPDLAPSEDDILTVLAVTAEGNPIYERIEGVTRSQVEAATFLLQREVSSPSNSLSTRYQRPAQLLYQWLIAELEAELEQRGVNNIVFVMPPGMRSLPVAALQEGDSEQFLIENYSLGSIPSLSYTDTRYRNIRTVSLLAMGTAEFEDQPALPAVPIELDTILAEWGDGISLRDQEFTPNNLEAQLDTNPYGIVHLATHADFAPGPLSNSFIQFFGRDRVTLDQLRAVVSTGEGNLPVELMVLSACETGVGSEDFEIVIGAELGFGGAAYAAGVKSVLASLWAVSDAATAGLMIEFYDVLREEGIIKAEALRQAQLALARGELTLEGDTLRTTARGQRSARDVQLPRRSVTDVESPNFSHPYYWAAFTMIGNPW
jgi:CHAT domain-containing protein